MREYRYVVDRDGRIFHDGTEIVDPLTLRFFLRAMTRTDDGRWLVVCQGEQNWFEALDTPFVVQRLDLSARDGHLDGAVTLVLAGDVREPLDPRTLENGAGGLGCRIRKGMLPARFGRVAMQQIAPFLVEDPEIAHVAATSGGASAALVLDGTRYPVRDARSAVR
jgi:hypothetical protein